MHRPGIAALIQAATDAKEQGHVADHAGNCSDDDGSRHVNVARGRSYGHQTGYAAAHHSQSTGLSFQPAGDKPGERSRSGRGVGDHQGRGSQTVGREGGAGVEAEPSEPEQARSDHGHGNVMRLHDVGAVAHPLADDQGDSQGREAGADVHHRSAGKVESSHLGHPAARPDPMGQRIIDQSGPEESQHDEGAELDPFRHGGGEDGESHSREDQLEGHIDEMRNVASQWRLTQPHAA